MPNVPLENLLDKTNNSIYDLVILASKRALEIAEGAPKLINEAEVGVDSTLKPTTIALEEIAEAKVKLKKEKEKKNK